MQPAVEDPRSGPEWEMNHMNTSQIAAQAHLEPMTIRVVGVDERMLSAIALFFKIRLGNRYAVGDPQDAHIWLFDVDTADGRSEWDTHQMERPEVPAILMSIEQIDLGSVRNAAFAPKPLNAELLTDALERITQSPTRKGAAVPTQEEPKKESKGSPNGVAVPPSYSSIHSDVESAIEPDTFMPDSTWYQEPADAADPPEIASPDGYEAKGAPQAHRGAPRCYAAAMKLGEQHVQAFIGSAPDIDAEDPRQVAKAQFDPDRFLVGAVSHAAAMAARTGQPVKVSGNGWDIVIRRNPDRVFVDTKQLQLRTLATLPLQGEIKTEVLDQRKTRTFDGVKWRLSALQWTLALMAARGRVPVGTELHTKVKLTQWPNLTRLQAFPNAMRISSLWSRQPISLLDSASTLGISQRYVFAFYAAVQSLGLVEIPYTESTAPQVTTNRPANRRRGLFRKILAHLHLG